jgi:PTS system mannose-specific IIA component
MIGIVLVTHGRLAAEFRAALEHVVGPQKQIESIAIGPDDDIEQRRQDIVSAVTKVNSGAGRLRIDLEPASIWGMSVKI